MSKITIGRGSQQLGQFTEEEVLAGLRSGQFTAADLWWKEGMEKWETLSSFPGIEAANAVPPLLGTETSESAGYIPWEDEKRGFVQRFWQTSIGILTDPWGTFEKMPASGGYGKPLLFALVGMVFGAMGNALVQAIVTMAQLSVQSTEETSAILGAQAVGMIPGVVCGIPMYVAGGVIGLFIGTGIFHLLLMLFGAANRDFEATFRASAYVGGLTQLLALIPCCALLLLPWTILIQIIAYTKTHRTGYWRVICAYLLPILLCCGCFIILGFVLFSAFGLALGDGNLLEQIRSAVEQATNE